MNLYTSVFDTSTASDLACRKATCGRHGEQSGKRAGRIWSTKMTVTQMWNVNRNTSILDPVARRNDQRRALRRREQKILQQKIPPHLWVRCRRQRCWRCCEVIRIKCAVSCNGQVAGDSNRDSQSLFKGTRHTRVKICFPGCLRGKCYLHQQIWRQAQERSSLRLRHMPFDGLTYCTGLCSSVIPDAKPRNGSKVLGFLAISRQIHISLLKRTFLQSSQKSYRTFVRPMALQFLLSMKVPTAQPRILRWVGVFLFLLFIIPSRY